MEALRLVYLAIDLDSGSVSINSSIDNRNIEPIPFGKYYHCCTPQQANKLKKRFEKKPCLIEKFIAR